MKHESKHMTRKPVLLHLASLAFLLSFSGCSDDARHVSADGSGGAQNATTAGTQGGAQADITGGSAATSDEATGGVVSNGGSTGDTGQTSAGGTMQELATGGAAQVATGGAAQVATGGAAQIATGGAAQVATGGAAQVATGGAAQVATGGAAQIATGGAAQVATGGAAQVATGGAAQIATGGAAQVATGGAGEVATGGAPPVETSAPEEPLCVDSEGAAIPYDYSVGLVGEYAFELSMSCEVGGYLMPLLMADPEQMTLVDAFITEATDWYRADILNCEGATTQLDDNSYGLLPVSQSDDLSAEDVDASLALFSMVMDRHDALPDAMSPEKKVKIKNRINSVKARAVHGGAVGLTKSLTEPECVPAAPSGG